MHRNEIHEYLERALRQLQDLPPVREGTIAVPGDTWQRKCVLENMFRARNEWLAAVPALRDVHRWVEVHWNTARQTQPPGGTIRIGVTFGQQGEVQLDDLSAAFKLLLAAWSYGAETVARFAIEFAAHGMIETSRILLLKGMSMLKAQALDDYCTLLPYREALKRLDAGSMAWPSAVDKLWPPETVDNTCALEVRGFERRGVTGDDFELHASPLLQYMYETLLLVLGLVWGKGLRLFGYFDGISEPIAAVLPFLRASPSGGGSSMRTEFVFQGWGLNTTTGPLAIPEVADLVDSYARLPAPTRKCLDLALRRLRDSSEKIEIEDRVIDMSIALEALFMEGELWNQKKIVSRRASWYFADSHAERERIRKLIKEFYDYRSAIIHGHVPEELAPQESQRRDTRLVDVEDVIRASLKGMISEGRPESWEESKDPKQIRHDPPRAERDIPSVKSDSLSWSVEEQKEIDQMLEAVWRPTVDNAPEPSPDAIPVQHHGVNRDQIEQYKQEGTYYIIRIPAVLYMAHPKWLERTVESEALDEHTRYYCEGDVKRHMELWQRAVDEKKSIQFTLDLEPAEMYLPKTFDFWAKLL